MGLFLASVIMPNQWPRFFSRERSEKLAAALSDVSKTCEVRKLTLQKWMEWSSVTSKTFKKHKHKAFKKNGWFKVIHSWIHTPQIILPWYSCTSHLGPFWQTLGSLKCPKNWNRDCGSWAQCWHVSSPGTVTPMAWIHLSPSLSTPPPDEKDDMFKMLKLWRGRSPTASVSHYLLGHIGLRKVVEDERNLLLDIIWRLHNPLCLVSGHQQGVDVGCVYRGLEVR